MTTSSPLTVSIRFSRLPAVIKDPIGPLSPQPAGSHTTPSSTFNRSLQTKHLPSSLNHLLAQSSCPKCPQTGNNTPISPSLNCARQMGHFVTRTPSKESLSLTFPSFVVRLDSTVIGAGRRVCNASEGAAGDLAGPRNWAMWLNPYLLVILRLAKSQGKRG